MRKNSIIIAMFVIMLFSTQILASGAAVDSISAASTQSYYQTSSLTGEALFTALKERRSAISIATVNADGTPNAAVAIPGVVNESVLMFGLAENQTKVNLMERGYAVITAYIYHPDAQDKFERNIGARLIVKYISDKVTIDKLMEQTKARTGTIFVQIEKILPLG